MSKDITALESMQKFVCKIATKHWTCEYQELLETCAIPSLAEHRTKLKLCQLYNILHGQLFSPRCFCASFKPLLYSSGGGNSGGLMQLG